MTPFIIAEIGSNWAKYEDPGKNQLIADAQIYEAKEVGASAVKYQLYTCQDLYGPKVKGTSFENDFNRFALDRDLIPRLAETAQKNEIQFMCSAFSVDGFQYVDDYVLYHKLASLEATDPDIVNWLMNQNKPVFYSDGCLNHLNFGRQQDIKMTCVSKYPADVSDYDLNEYSGKYWGLSDHTFGFDLAIMALRRGCLYFEKHVDFFFHEGTVTTPDKCISVDKAAFTQYVNMIKGFDPEMCYKTKHDLKSKYARCLTEDGWFRPVPEGANLELVNSNICGSKL